MLTLIRASVVKLELTALAFNNSCIQYFLFFALWLSGVQESRCSAKFEPAATSQRESPAGRDPELTLIRASVVKLKLTAFAFNNSC